MLKRIVVEDGCWLWQGTVNTVNGYGRIAAGDMRGDGPEIEYVHRLAYRIWIGPIPAGLTIDHLCRIRRCVNPAHLEAVTLRENHARRPKPIACPAGHEYTEENTYEGSSGRYCRACHAQRERDRRQLRRRQHDGA